MPRQTHDAVVIGGGIVGAHCGLQLARAGLDDVVVLERDAPASGASGRAAGHLTIYGHERFGSAASRLGRELYEALEAEHDVLTFHREPSYTLAYTAEGAAYLRETHESGGLETSLLSVEAFAERRPEFATEEVTAVRRDPDGVYTDPERLTLAVHEAALDAGATLEIGAVTDLRPGDGGPLTVETDAGVHEAPTVVVAAGVWTERLLGLAGIDIALRPRTSQIAILDPADPLRVPVWSAPDFSVYGRPTPEGRVLFGGGVDTPVTDLEGFRNRALVPFLEEIGELAPYVLPALEHATLHADRAGRVSATPDRYPHIGQTAVAGLYVCGGFNGEGLSNSPFGARLLADIVLDRDPIVDPGPFDPRRVTGEETFRIGNAVEWWADR